MSVEPEPAIGRASGLLLADGSDVPLQCARALASHHVAIRAVVVGPAVPRDAAAALAGQFPNPPPVFMTSRPDEDPALQRLLKQFPVDFLFSCFYEHRIHPGLIGASRFGGTNIHPSVLPFNRGFHTSFWGIVDGTPLGATMHWISEGLDEGDIIAQETLPDDGLMAAHEVRNRQRALCVDLFVRHLPAVLTGRAPRVPQSGPGSYHFKKDILARTTFRGEDRVAMGELLRLLRGTAHGDNGLIVVEGGRRFKLQGRILDASG